MKKYKKVFWKKFPETISKISCLKGVYIAIIEIMNKAVAHGNIRENAILKTNIFMFTLWIDSFNIFCKLGYD